GRWWTRIVASVAFDSRVQPALAEARDAAAVQEGDGETSFQLLFEAQGTDIDLLCELAADGWRIIGQALAANGSEPGWKVCAGPTASHGATGKVEAEADSLGEFHLGGLAPGRVPPEPFEGAAPEGDQPYG